jgi:release factor glutamine methyltransferase
MTISKKRKELFDKLKNNSIENAHIETDILISHITKKTKEEIILNPGHKVNVRNNRKINKLAKKRISGWPISYLTKEKSFYNLNFIVSKKTLIPRPESEIIIDDIIGNEKIKKETSIIDVGTGSGCLIISVADIFKENNNIKFYGTDISRGALKIAKKNSKKNNLSGKIKFKKGNLLKPVLRKIKKGDVIIIANLPYLTKNEIKNSPTIKHETKKALYGGRDGLNQVKKIKSPKKKITIYKEINPWQEEKLKKIVYKKLKNETLKITTIKDYSQNNRLLKIEV